MNPNDRPPQVVEVPDKGATRLDCIVFERHYSEWAKRRGHTYTLRDAIAREAKAGINKRRFHHV